MYAETKDEQVSEEKDPHDQQWKVFENARGEAPFVAVQILQTQTPLEGKRPCERIDGKTIKEVIALWLKQKQCLPGGGEERSF